MSKFILRIRKISQIYPAIVCFLGNEVRQQGIFVEMRRSNQYLIVSLSLLFACATAKAQTSGDPVREAQRLTRVAQTAEQRNQPDEAIKAYETIALIARSSPAIASSALIRAGNIYMATGRFDKAANSFRGASSLNP